MKFPGKVSFRFIAALAVLAAGSILSSCGSKETKAAAPPPAVPVVVANAVQKTVPVTVNAIGSVEQFQMVQIKTHVTAQLMAIHFKEGEEVRKGQLLFTLDKRPFEADQRKAEAILAQDEAKLANQKIQAKRYRALFEQGVVAREQNDAEQTSLAALEAQVGADKAAVEAAKLNVQYCEIRSPIDGRAGSYVVNLGNEIKANDTGWLVVINQIRPIFVSFSVPEQFLPEIKKYMAKGTLQVEAAPPNISGEAPRGKLTFIDNTVDRATGTIRMKATFNNADSRLWPGQFVNVAVDLTTMPNAVLVPSQAVQTGQQGNFIFVVKDDKTAENRTVVVGRTIAGQTVIQQGIAPGETVVIDGQVRLVPGAKVDARSAPAPNAAPTTTAEGKQS